MNIDVITVETLTIYEHHLDIIYSVCDADQLKFSTKIFYHDVSFSSLQQRYSHAVIDRVTSYIALFEGMKFCSLFPKRYDISCIAPHLSALALDLFVKIYQGVFAQNWYENGITDYQHPEFFYTQALGTAAPIAIPEESDTILTGCGGGKDSMVAMKILTEVGVPFATMQYSHSVYGKAELQHDLIDQVVSEVSPDRSHRISIFDEFLESPLFELYFPERAGIIAPETPVSVFESLPLMLAQNYRYLCLAHEKSANTGNFFWEAIHREVNHQWGKGLEAEILLDRFIQTYLVSNAKYFSILQPLYDLRIFKKLSQYPEAIAKIHSCNIKKPWCKKCPKCAYVWLGLMSSCNPEIVDRVFQVNLFDDPDLLPTFEAMIGLTKHTPFECIGEVAESRLMMKRCLEKGLSGKALDIFSARVLSNPEIDWSAIEQTYDTLYADAHEIPDWLFQKIEAKL